MLGREFTAVERIFKMRMCRGISSQDGHLNHGGRSSGGKGGIHWYRWACCGAVAVHVGMAHRLYALGGGEWAMAPLAYNGLRAADSGGWSSAITPWCPFSVARSSGVLPSLSGLLGLTSPRLSSTFTTPSSPFQAAR